MTHNHRNSVLAAAVLVFVLGGTLVAQDLREMKVFAPSDPSVYGSGPQPNEGYFFVFDGLLWRIEQPNQTPIGHNSVRRVFYDAGRPATVDPGPPRRITRAGSKTTSEIHRNSQTTGPMGAAATGGGNRVEFGRVYGDAGWLFSTYRLNDQVQRFSGTDVDVVLSDNDGLLQGYVTTLLGYDGGDPDYFFRDLGPRNLPFTFDTLSVENRVETWGVELMALMRPGQVHRGGFLEFFAGMRYLEFDETFRVEGRGTEVVNSDGDSVGGLANWRFVYDLGPDSDPAATDWSIIGPGVVLADSIWTSEAENHIIGPQIGGRWFKKNGRWTLSAEGRFFAALNVQNIRNQGVLGSELNTPPPWNLDFDPTDPTISPALNYFMPTLREPLDFDNKITTRTFSPGGEVRLELICELTKAVSVKAGWSGLWLGGIARGAAMPDYKVSRRSVMGVNTANNRQVVFANGLNVGVMINR